jgi:putative transposase
LKKAEILGSMGSVGDCYDNAMMEAFWGTLQLEVLDRRKSWNSRAELANAIFEWMECWYNPTRHHSSVGMRSPVDFEQLHTPVRSQPLTPTSGVRQRGEVQGRLGQLVSSGAAVRR